MTPDLSLFWSFVVAWSFVGAVLFAWYAKQISMLVELRLPVLIYEHPDFLSERQVRFLIWTLHGLVFLFLWPKMAADLERLR